MPETKVSEREELILQAVVHQYITTAEPVGSRAVVKRYRLEISPATVRNVMADLEEMGYLQQLHTSSGRVPTDSGYRYYVDYLMEIQELTQTERQHLETNLRERLSDADEILRQTSQLLALISNQTAIVEAPIANARVRHLDVLPLDAHRAVLLIADNHGRVRTMTLPVEKSFNPEAAQRLSLFLNDHLQDELVETLSDAFGQKLRMFVDEQRKLAEQAMSLLTLLPGEKTGQLYLEGATQLFQQPEFKDVGRVQEVFDLLGERDRMMELLRAGIVNPDPHNSRVVIGSESKSSGMEYISVVSAPYTIDGEQVGMVGILGPRRMPYSKLSGIVEYTASKLGALLTRLSQ